MSLHKPATLYLFSAILAIFAACKQPEKKGDVAPAVAQHEAKTDWWKESQPELLP